MQNVAKPRLKFFYMSIYLDNYLHDTWQMTLRPEIWLFRIQLSSQVHERLLSILTKTRSFQAVWIGELELFRNVVEKFSNTFNSDRTLKLIVRLWHNVLRTRHHIIRISHSRFALTDVAKKLRLDSANPVAYAESIVSKANQDGVIDATIDHANG